jgi:hypothetical protein
MIDCTIDVKVSGNNLLLAGKNCDFENWVSLLEASCAIPIFSSPP